MRIFYQIIIISLIVISLFFLSVKEDIVSTLDNISSYLNKNISDKPVAQLTEKEDVLVGKVDTPGPLRVINNILSTNKEVVLSKDKIISLTNKYRKESDNLEALKENNQLNLSALKKLEDMFDNQYFEHESLDGKGVGDLGEEVGYEYILIGENLAMGNFKDDQSLLDAWIASEGHRENIVNENYTEIGVAVARGKFEGREVWIAVQHFGTPQSICPTINQILYSAININQSKIKELESDLSLRLNMINKNIIYDGKTKSEQINIYNSLVNYYNNLIKDTRENIDNYNNQVRLFNNCLLENK
jgi:uncharacterized protein YkwD